MISSAWACGAAAAPAGRRAARERCARAVSAAAAAVGAAGDADSPARLRALLASTRWLLPDPRPRVQWVPLEGSATPAAGFWVARDDQLRVPGVAGGAGVAGVGGNKARKLDGLLPALAPPPGGRRAHVVTCGGAQSAHASALAVACAGSRLSAHLLLRGEPPACTAVGHLRMTLDHAASVRFVPRGEYAARSAMLEAARAALAAAHPGEAVTVLPEGGAGPAALLGLLRLVAALADSGGAGGGSGGGPAAGAWDGAAAARAPLTLFVDSGTGTTAAGLALGARLLRLPWRVIGITLAAGAPHYEAHAEALVAAFASDVWRSPLPAARDLPLVWAPRLRPRRFGRVLPGEVAACAAIARRTGVPLDPIWSLAAWEAAEAHAAGPALMLHTGGSELTLQGLAQRFPGEAGG